MNPITRKTGMDPLVGPTSFSQGKSEVTAQKVGKVAQMPVISQSRNVHLLSEANSLQKRIQKDWNRLDPYELAELISQLEGRVALLEGSDPAIEKIKKQAEQLHFQFVFPVVLELEKTNAKEMPFSFARAVADIGKRILSEHSMEPFHELNLVQQKEIIRYAEGG